MVVDGDNLRLLTGFADCWSYHGSTAALCQRCGSFAKSGLFLHQSTGAKLWDLPMMSYRSEYSYSAFQCFITKAIEEPRETTGSEPVREIADQNIHLVVEVSNASPYLNEAIRVVYKLYAFLTILLNQRLDRNDSPKKKSVDFWSQNIDNRDQQVRVGTYQGQQYR
jgi:hypothetical protein